MLKTYPKTRPPLPEALQAIYTAYYKSNRGGHTTASSLAQKMESWLHRQVARDVAGRPDAAKRTLEVGAGTLNQLPYEPRSQSYDIVEPFSDLYESSPLLASVRNVYSDISWVPASSNYDRITSIATLEHICDLPDVIARSGLLLAGDGVFRAAIPSEGTWLWALGWKLTTGLEFRLRHGFDYGLIVRHEHVNTADEVEEVLRHFFGDVSCKVFGLLKSMSLYRYYECRGPMTDRCRQFLESSRTRQSASAEAVSTPGELAGRAT